MQSEKDRPVTAPAICPLREPIAQRAVECGFKLDAQHLPIATGFQRPIDPATPTVIDAGDHVFVEAPTSPDAPAGMLRLSFARASIAGIGKGIRRLGRVLRATP
jgi:DNA-binding transcriptional MocR family regulator